MAHTVVWLSAALDDVDAIASFIGSDSASYASALVQRFLLVARSLQEFPMRGKAVPEWNDESIREIPIGNYRMIYQVHRSQVRILTVIHGARLLPDSLKERSE